MGCNYAMLNIHQVELVQQRLALLPGVVDFQHQRSSAFPEETLRWLKDTELVFENAGLPNISELPILRSRLLSVLHNNTKDPKFPSSRKHKEAISTEVLEEAERALNQAIAAKVETIREAEGYASRLVAVAKAKGILDEARKVQPHQEALQYLHGALSRDQDTATALVHLNGLMGQYDVLVVLDRAAPDL